MRVILSVEVLIREIKGSGARGSGRDISYMKRSRTLLSCRMTSTPASYSGRMWCVGCFGRLLWPQLLGGFIWFTVLICMLTDGEVRLAVSGKARSVRLVWTKKV